MIYYILSYVFLIEQMHKGVSQVFSLQNNSAPLPSPLDETSLIHFAKEAELNQNYELAARYYQVWISQIIIIWGSQIIIWGSQIIIWESQITIWGTQSCIMHFNDLRYCSYFKKLLQYIKVTLVYIFSYNWHIYYPLSVQGVFMLGIVLTYKESSQVEILPI